MSVQLFEGDCLEIINTLRSDSVDLVLTDLPYGITSLEWDKPLDLEKFWECLDYVCKPDANVLLFASGIFTFHLYQSNPTDFKYKLIWKKNVPTGMSSAKYRPMKYYEEILVFNKGRSTYNPQLKERFGVGKSCYNYEHYCGDSNHLTLDKKKKFYDPDFVQPSDVLEFDVVPNRSGKSHPTEKPVALLDWLVKTYSNSGDLVLDCCMGSGSTGVACRQNDRSFIGIEKDKEFFKYAKSRLDDSNFWVFSDFR